MPTKTSNDHALVTSDCLRRLCFILATLPLTVGGLHAADQTTAPADAASSHVSLVEQDWIRQAEAIDAVRRGVQHGLAAATQGDAAGAVDGVKDGKYAFHTNQEPNPWWQVDLGESVPIARVVVYNRLDYAPGLHNADTLILLDLRRRPHVDETIRQRGKTLWRHYRRETVGGDVPARRTQGALRASADSQSAADFPALGRSRDLQ